MAQSALSLSKLGFAAFRVSWRLVAAAMAATPANGGCSDMVSWCCKVLRGAVDARCRLVMRRGGWRRDTDACGAAIAVADGARGSFAEAWWCA